MDPFTSLLTRIKRTTTAATHKATPLPQAETGLQMRRLQEGQHAKDAVVARP
jgi:hypothetical protein